MPSRYLIEDERIRALADCFKRAEDHQLATMASSSIRESVRRAANAEIIRRKLFGRPA
jgi:hypothetical protein